MFTDVKNMHEKVIRGGPLDGVRVIVHLGMHKTASSFLQRRFLQCIQRNLAMLTSGVCYVIFVITCYMKAILVGVQRWLLTSSKEN